MWFNVCVQSRLLFLSSLKSHAGSATQRRSSNASPLVGHTTHLLQRMLCNAPHPTRHLTQVTQRRLSNVSWHVKTRYPLRLRVSWSSFCATSVSQLCFKDDCQKPSIDKFCNFFSVYNLGHAPPLRRSTQLALKTT